MKREGTFAVPAPISKLAVWSPAVPLPIARTAGETREIPVSGVPPLASKPMNPRSSLPAKLEADAPIPKVLDAELDRTAVGDAAELPEAAKPREPLAQIVVPNS